MKIEIEAEYEHQLVDKMIDEIKKLSGAYDVLLLRDKHHPTSEAVGVIERDYRDDVKGVADDIVRRIRDGEISNLNDAIHETVEWCSRVIETWQAQMGLLASKNDGYGVEEGLVGPSDFKSGIPWDKLMFCAMEQDVIDELEHMGVEPNRDGPWFGLTAYRVVRTGSEDEPLYWSKAEKWTDDEDEAKVYFDTDGALPADGEWDEST
jgi:hypothetical protein